MRVRIVLLAALVGLILALWPPVTSLDDLTGEETLPAQLRGVIHWFNTAVRPQPDLAPTAVVGTAPPSMRGMNTFLQLEVLPEVRAETLRRLREAGFGVIRQQFPWEDIEIHAKGDFVDRRNDPAGVDAWAKYDNIIDLAEQYDFAVIARLDNPPAWSRAAEGGGHGPPDDFADYADFVAAVAERYRGRIGYYQLWNEPNIYPEWGERAVDPLAFTDLLCRGYEAVKGADPDAVVLAGALSPTVAFDGRNQNNLVFLEQMYRAGAGACFDVFSAQGYGLWSGAADRRLRPTVINFPHHLFVRDVMVQNGDAAKPLWISEMGWNSVPDGLAAPYGRVSAAEKGRYGAEAYARIATEWPWVEVSNYWFYKRPSDAEQEQPWYHFHLVAPDFEPTPAWPILTAYTAAAPPSSAAEPADGLRRLRPGLFQVSAALLFFSLLQGLHGRSANRVDELA